MNNSHKSFKIDRELGLSVVALGITSVVTQIILLRECFSVFYGNELVFGIVLANWMILTGIGALAGRYIDKFNSKKYLVTAALFLLAVLPAVTLFLLNYLRNIVFPVGAMIGITQILIGSWILLLPFCFLSGFSFTLFLKIISENKKINLIAYIYSLEAFGSVIGGLIFNVVLIYFLTSFQALKSIMALNLFLMVLYTLKYCTPAAKISAIILGVACISVAALYNLDKYSKEFIFTGQSLLYYKDTPYGNLVITKQAEQYNFYENNILMFSTNNPAQNEEAVHYAMLQHANPKNVLLISGGLSGVAQEILKYNVNRIDYVEINPWLIKAGKQFTAALDDSKINIINQDARLFLKTTGNCYDVVMSNLPEPTTAQINRFYTIEFFTELKKKLSQNAVVSFCALSSTDYLSEEAKEIYSVLYNTLKSAYKNILIIPGIKNYFLASDGTLNIHIAGLAERRGIKNLYVNQYYLDNQILEDRSNYIECNLDPSAQINRDFTPVAYHRQLVHWLSYFQINHWIIAVISALILILVALKYDSISIGIFAVGFTASSIEMLLIIAFQILYGFVYQAIGIIITIFMAGLAIGAMIGQRELVRIDINNFTKYQFIIALYAVVQPFIFLIVKNILPGYFVVHIVFFVLAGLIAVLIGIEFSLGAKLKRGTISSVASDLYGIDLIGSALGALIVSVYLLPLLGIIKLSFLVAFLSLSSGFIAFLSRDRFRTM